MPTLRVTPELLEALHGRTILLQYNSAAPGRAGYGWLRMGDEIVLEADSLPLESNSGLYGGPYKPMIGGGRKSCGFCRIGSFSYSYSALPEGMEVGRYCSISSGLRVLDSTHPADILTTSAISFRPKNKLFADYFTPRLAAFAERFDVRGGKRMPVLEHDVWIGANVTLAMGVRIGTGAIVGSGAIVTADVPPYTLVAGSPAVVRRQRFDPELTQQLLASRWWDIDPTLVFNLDFTRPGAVCEELLRKAGTLPHFEPRTLDLGDFIASAAPCAPQADEAAQEMTV